MIQSKEGKHEADHTPSLRGKELKGDIDRKQKVVGGFI